MANRHWEELKKAVYKLFPDTMTHKQKEIATLLAYGLSRTEIAISLGKSESTIKDHVKVVVAKLKLNSSRHVSAWVIERLVVDGLGKQ